MSHYNDDYWFMPQPWPPRKPCTCGVLITMGKEGENPIFHSDWCEWFEGTSKEEMMQKYEEVIKSNGTKNKR